MLVTLGLLGALAGCGGSSSSDHNNGGNDRGGTRPGATGFATTLPGGWQLRFHDEFDGPVGSRPDPARWGYDTGRGGWGNRELQEYTDLATNARLDGDGVLEIVARAHEIGRGRQYSSARITTRDTFTARYGRYQARLQLPAGQGLWPAFWLNGTCAAGWPRCGEIDVMESVDEVPRTVRGRVHGPGPSYRSGIGRDWRVRAELDKAFHVYGVEWDPQYVAFTFDGAEYTRVRRDQLPAGDVWALDHDAYLILNVAVGGNWPGNPSRHTEFPARLRVDWVRVYQR
jgi:beta-glucanase (GH16 family)